MIKKLTFLTAAAMSIAFAVPAEAQWAAFTANNAGAEFWDNLSNDGTSCNIGFVVTGVATAAGCANERPEAWLPFTGTGYNRYRTPTTFSFLGGAISVTVSQNGDTGGDIAGANQDWGVWRQTGLGPRTTQSLNVGLPTAVAFAAGESWGFYVSTTDLATRYSDTDAQFALFGKAPPACANPIICGPIVLGIEDVFTAGDRDFNDVVATLEITVGIDTFDSPTVPEPSTYALMAAGLAALGLAARRRRNTA